MGSVEWFHCNIFRLLNRPLTISVLKFQLLPLFLLFVFVNFNRIAIFVKNLAAIFLFFFLYDVDLLFASDSIPLQTIPHPIGIVMNIVDTIAIDFGASIHDLARPDPLLVVLLLG